MLKQLRFFIPVIIFFLFAFSSGKKDLIADPVYTAADTARIDSSVAVIENYLLPVKFSDVSKTFNCENPESEGRVLVKWGNDLTHVLLTECGSDHGFSYSEALFNKDKLVFYNENNETWSFDTEHSSDSASGYPATLDETTQYFGYIENGLLIKSIHSHTITYSYNKERKFNEETVYYFDEPGEHVAECEKRFQQWIKFAHSKKSYIEFFQNDGK